MSERLTCGPCIKGRLIILVIVIAEFFVSIEKTGLDLGRRRHWKVTVYLLDMFLKSPENRMRRRKHGCL